MGGNEGKYRDKKVVDVNDCEWIKKQRHLNHRLNSKISIEMWISERR